MTLTGKVFLGFLFVVIVVCRFAYLDQDVPAYNIGGLSQTDEPYYTIVGHNSYLSDEGRLVEELNKPPLAYLFYHNYLPTYFALKVLGNNYYGLRALPVLSSIILILMLIDISRKRLKGRSSFYWFLIFCGFEFSFLLMSRFQNPQIYGVFWLAFSLWLFHRSELQSSSTFRILSGLVLVFSVLFVYPYLIFALFGFGLFMLERSIASTSFKYIKELLVVGALTVLVSASFLFLIGVSPIQIIEVYKSINEVRDESIPFELRNMLISALTQIPFTNFFRFNLAALLPFLSFLLVMPIIWKRLPKNSIYKLTFFIAIGAFTQSAFVESYPFKKWFLLFPVVCISIIWFIEIWQKERVRLKAVEIGVLFLALLVSITNWRITNASEYWSGMQSYQYIELPEYLNYLLILPCVGLIGYALISRFFNLTYHQLLIPILSIAGIVFSVYFMFVTKQFVLRDLLVVEKSRIDGKLIAGEFPHAFSFYNNGKVLGNPYDVEFFEDQKLEREKFLSNVEEPMVWIEKFGPRDERKPVKNIFGKDVHLRASYGTSPYQYGVYYEQ